MFLNFIKVLSYFFKYQKVVMLEASLLLFFWLQNFPLKDLISNIGPYLKFWHGTYPCPKKPSLFIFCFSKYHFWIPFPQKLTWVSFSSKRSFFGFPFGVSANLGWFRWDCRAPKFKSHMISVSLENRVPLLY